MLQFLQTVAQVFGGIYSMTEQPSLHEELVHLRSEIGRLTDEITGLTKENDVLRSEINFLKRAAEYFYKESLDARR